MAFCGRSTIVDHEVVTFDHSDLMVRYGEIIAHILPFIICAAYSYVRPTTDLQKRFLVYVFVTAGFGIYKAYFGARWALFILATMHNIMELEVMKKISNFNVGDWRYAVYILFVLFLPTFPLKMQGFLTQQSGLIIDFLFMMVCLKNNIREWATGSILHIFGQIFPLIFSGITGGSHYVIMEALIISTYPLTQMLLFDGAFTVGNLTPANPVQITPRMVKISVVAGIIGFAGVSGFMLFLNPCDMNHTYRAANVFEFERINPSVENLYNVLIDNSRTCSYSDGCLKYDVQLNFLKNQIWVFEEFNSNKTLWDHFQRAQKRIGKLDGVKVLFGRSLQPAKLFDESISNTNPSTQDASKRLDLG